MKQNKIFAVVKKPNGAAEIKLIENSLKTFSAIVDGKREIIPFPNAAGVCIIFDGQALETKKKPACFLPEYADLILGTALIVGIDIETGFVSLSEEQAENIMQCLKTNDASGFMGDIEKRINSGYLPNSDENSVYGFLSEVKTKYKTIKVNWLQKRKGA